MGERLPTALETAAVALVLGAMCSSQRLCPEGPRTVPRNLSPSPALFQVLLSGLLSVLGAGTMLITKPSMRCLEETPMGMAMEKEVLSVSHLTLILLLRP